MPDQDNKNLLFRAEYDGSQIKDGVEEVLNSLEKTQEAQALLKISIQETTAAMKENRKEAEKLAKSKPIDPKQIEKNRIEMDRLNAEYDEGVKTLTNLSVAQKKVNEVSKDYLKVQRDQKKNQAEISNAVSKFTNLNKVAGDGVKKLGNYVKDTAFSFVGGFAGGIIGSIIPALVQWVSGMDSASEATQKLKRDKETLNKVFDEAAKSVGDDVAKLEIYRVKLNDTNIPAAERIKIAKEYNKTASDTNQIDLQQIDNLELINQKIAAQNSLILKRAIALAATAKLGESATAFVDAQFNLAQATDRTGLDEQTVQAELKFMQERIDALGVDYKLSVRQREEKERLRKELAKTLNLSTREIGLLQNLFEQRDKAAKQLKQDEELLIPLIDPATLVSKAPKKNEKADREVENVFEQRLAELRARLSSLTASVLESEPIIQKKFEDQLNKEFLEIGRLLRDGKLTIPQADILKGVLKQINDVELSKSLEEFRKKREEALRKVNDAIIAVQVENENKRIANLRDEFEREREQINVNYDQSIQQIKIRSEEFNKQVDEDTKKQLISPAVARRKKLIAAYLFGGLLEQAEQAKVNAQVDLAFRQFQRTLELAKDQFDEQLLSDNEQTTRLIREQVAIFLEGGISYEQYQKNLTEILKRESAARRRIQLDEAQDALKRINDQLAVTTDPNQLKQLTAQRDALRAQISALRREIATGSATDENTEEKERLDKLVEYTQAINGLATAVLNFWQQVNAAEAAALDRSIALQNKRVENARELAENGNAELLEMEQKRLDELERKRADNARKQLAINNALATSQAIVAAITAIAQAVQTGNPLAAIAAVAAVIGAIGAAYSFANSLQPQEANFYEGTEFVEGPRGRDKVKANLTHGERVVPVKENEDYWQALTAIQNRTIPPDVLNSFVASYPRTDIPVIDFDRLSVATEGKLGYDSQELIGRVDKLNTTMEQVVVGLSEIGVNVVMDEEGFAASISKAARKRRLRSRS